MTFCVRQQFYILTSRPVVTVFGVKHLYGKNNLHCEIHAFITTGASNAEPNMQKRPNKIFFSTPTHLEKTKSNYDVYKALYQNCEIHSPVLWV